MFGRHIDRIGKHQRVLVVTAFLILGLVGSSGLATATPLVVPVEDTGGPGGGSAGPNEHVAIRLFDEVFTQQQANVCHLLMAASAVSHTPSGTFAGPTGFAQYAAELWTAFPDATFVIDQRLASGDLVTLRWTMTGRHLGAFGERDASGAPVRLDGLTILRFERHLIAESWIQYDRMSLVEQIEARPAAPDICPPCREP